MKIYFPVIPALFLFIEVKVCLAFADDVFSGRGWGFIGALSILSCLVVGAVFLIHHEHREGQRVILT